MGPEFLPLKTLKAPSQNAGGVLDRGVDPQGVCVHHAAGCQYQSVPEYIAYGSACSLLLGEERLFSFSDSDARWLEEWWGSTVCSRACRGAVAPAGG